MGYEVSEEKDQFTILEKNTRYTVDLKERLLKFSVDALKFLMNLSTKKELDVIKYQLSKSATSIGANYEEAQASSYREFVQKVRIALRKANESQYWFRIIEKPDLGDVIKRKYLINLNNS